MVKVYSTNIKYLILNICTLVVFIHSALECPTPELSSLEEWTSDRRAAVQSANLPLAGDCNSPPAQKVLMIGIDGLRAAAAAMLPLPNLRRLARIGTSSYWAHVQADAATVSGPGWASMFTGVEASKHLIDGNGDLTDISPDYPTVFKLVKDTYPQKKIAASVSWHPLIDSIIDHQDPNALDARYKAPNDEAMAEQARQWILSNDFDFIFVDFDDCDGTGHSSGFDGYQLPYRAAVQKTDGLVGELLDAVVSVSSGEEWLIVLTSDHGGYGTGHGPQDEYNLRIPFIVASNSPRVNIGQMPVEDPGSQLDVLPTIMHFFGSVTSCKDASYRFRIEKPDGKKKWRDCKFIAKRATATRCTWTGVSAMCPKTCGTCDICIDSSSRMKFKKSPEDENRISRDCTWTSNNASSRCNIEGMVDACRETCNNCDSGFDTDGQAFGFSDYERSEPPTCQSDPNNCGCDNQQQADYRGNISQTANGKTCQNWDSQSPHFHNRTPENYPTMGLEDNYCRNPDGEAKAWCYTTDPDTRWELCDVPSCVVN